MELLYIKISSIIKLSHTNNRGNKMYRILKETTLKRQKEVRKLYGELFRRLKQEAFKSELDKINIKLIISFNGWNPCYCKSRIRISDIYKDVRVSEYIIKLNLAHLYNSIVISGYSDSYYYDRPEKLKSLKHNRKKSLYFVILHELYHVLQNEKNIPYRNSIRYNEKEKQADDFALNYVNGLFINTETTKATSKQETSTQEISKHDFKTCKACSQEKAITEFRVYKNIRVLNICKSCEKYKARARKEAILV